MLQKTKQKKTNKYLVFKNVYWFYGISTFAELLNAKGFFFF